MSRAFHAAGTVLAEIGSASKLKQQKRGHGRAVAAAMMFGLGTLNRPVSVADRSA